MRRLLAERLLARLPADRATLARLQRLEHSQGLLDRTAHVQVMHGRVTERAGRVHDEQAPKRDALVLDQHAKLARDLVVRVGQQRERELAEFAVAPSPVREHRVGGRADDLRRRELGLH